MNGYTHRPLQKSQYTRVVLLEPGDANNTLHCSLHAIYDWSNPGYSALSYVWGPPYLNIAIICDGQECRISPNLAEALCRIRRSSEQTYVWVDAMCINQSNTIERNEQVVRMRDVYLNALQVHIWLGPEDDESALVARLLAAHLKKAAQPWWRVSTEFGPQAPEWPAMIRWLHRPWFWRVWTIQEARLASSAVVYYGDYSIDLKIVDKVMSLHVLTDQNQNLAGHLEEAFRLPGLSVRLSQWQMQRSEQYPLLDLLISARRHQATDARDKVYGLLGLAKEFSGEGLQDPLIRPDYAKSTEMVYRDTALYLIQRSKSLAVLNAVCHDTEFLFSHTMPSWVPRWDSLQGPILLGERSHSYRYPPPASCHIRENMENMLVVDGTIEVSVRVVMPEMRGSESDPTHQCGDVTIYDRLWQQLRDTYGSAMYVTGKHLILVYIEALTLGLNGRGEFFYYDYEPFFDTLHWMWGHQKVVLKEGKEAMNSTKDRTLISDEMEELQLSENKGDTSSWRREEETENNTLIQVPGSETALGDETTSDEEEETKLLPGHCKICQDPSLHDSPTSLHSYLTLNPHREALSGAPDDNPSSFNHRIHAFFQNSWYCYKQANLGFIAPCIDACNFRRFFLTADQRIGIGPAAMRSGDVVARLAGASGPCILRLDLSDGSVLNNLDIRGVEVEHELYHYIGECYVYELDELTSDEEASASNVIGLV